MNEAALKTAREDKDTINTEDIEYALEKIIM
jgi:ATP-dependent Zn protease